MKLTQVERAMLANQYRILMKLGSDNSESLSVMIDALESGYEQEFEECLWGISREPVPEAICKEVNDILQMLRVTRRAATERHLGAAIIERLTFEGFDANEAEGHYYYAEFLVTKKGVWSELLGLPLNSHSGATLPMYRRMREVWQQTAQSLDMPTEDVERIANAAYA